MSTLSTTSLNWLADQWESLYATAVLSGIVGDLAHKARGGYHISREDQPSTNYSVIRPDDKPGMGPSDRAAAIDMTMSTSDMIKCHTRIRSLWSNRANDPRFKYINGWNGWDGEGDAGRYDVVKGTVTVATPDHKWHIHLEIRRRYVNDMVAMKAILSLLRGESLASYLGDDDMTKDEMLALLKSAEGRTAVANAVWNTDNIIGAPGNPKPGTNADGTPINTHWGAAYYVQSIYNASVSSRDYAAGAKAAASRDLVDEAAIATALLSNTAFIETLSARVASKVPTGVDVTPEELTSALKAALREGVAE